MKLINEAVAILRVQSNDLEAVAARYRAAEEFGAANKVIRTAAYIDYAATLLSESEAVLEVYGSAGAEEYDVVSSKFAPKAEPVIMQGDHIEGTSVLDRELLVGEPKLGKTKYVPATELPNENLVGREVVVHPGHPYEEFEGRTGTVIAHKVDGIYEFDVAIDGGGEYAFYRSEIEVLAAVPTGRDLVGKVVKLTNPDMGGYERYIGQEYQITNHDPEGSWAMNGRYPYLTQRVTDGRVLSMNDSEFEVL